MRTQINEVIDLMGRMNLFENAIPRKQISRNEIIDMLNQQNDNGGGTWVSFIYVKPQKFYKTHTNWRTDDMSNALANYTNDGNESWFNTVNNYNNSVKAERERVEKEREAARAAGKTEDEINNIKVKLHKMSGIDGMVVATRYNCHWTTDKSYAAAYAKHVEALHKLRMERGVAIPTDGTLGDNNNQRTKSDYGATINQTGKLAKDLNLAGMNKPKSTCYIIGADGSIKGEIGGDVVKAMNKLPDSPKPEKDVAEALKDNPEALDAYMKARKELDKSFKAANFVFDKILSIVAKVNGVAYYYINDALKTEIAEKSEVYVNPQEMQKIAVEQLANSVKDIEDTYDPLKI